MDHLRHRLYGVDAPACMRETQNSILKHWNFEIYHQLSLQGK